MVQREDAILFSGGAQGTEAEFGAAAERAGHRGSEFLVRRPQAGADARTPRAQPRGAARRRGEPGLRVAADESPLPGHPDLPEDPPEHLVSDQHGQEVYVVGAIEADRTVRGGTGWGAEFAKLCNKPLFVFDQPKARWFQWEGDEWQPRDGSAQPVVRHAHFTGTGTRFLDDNGRAAIHDLFARSF